MWMPLSGTTHVSTLLQRNFFLFEEFTLPLLTITFKVNVKQRSPTKRAALAPYMSNVFLLLNEISMLLLQIQV